MYKYLNRKEFENCYTLDRVMYDDLWQCKTKLNLAQKEETCLFVSSLFILSSIMDVIIGMGKIYILIEIQILIYRCSYIQGVFKKKQHLIFMNIRCCKSQFTVGLRTRLFLGNCADRIR
mgnify:CR=1 FL=1